MSVGAPRTPYARLPRIQRQISVDWKQLGAGDHVAGRVAIVVTDIFFCDASCVTLVLSLKIYSMRNITKERDDTESARNKMRPLGPEMRTSWGAQHTKWRCSLAGFASHPNAQDQEVVFQLVREIPCADYNV